MEINSGLFLGTRTCPICKKKTSMPSYADFRKVADGHVCKKCFQQLSPFCRDRGYMSILEIKVHLDYRKENQIKLNAFHPTREYGYFTKIYIDDTQKLFCVSPSGNYLKDNADLIDFSLVTGCKCVISEYTCQEGSFDKHGVFIPCQPPCDKRLYRFSVTMDTLSPYYNTIHFDLECSATPITSMECEDYRRLEQSAKELTQTFHGETIVESVPRFHLNVAESMPQNNQQTVQTVLEQPAVRWTCPNCGRINTKKFCPVCGTKYAGQ